MYEIHSAVFVVIMARNFVPAHIKTEGIEPGLIKMGAVDYGPKWRLAGSITLKSLQLGLCDEIQTNELMAHLTTELMLFFLEPYYLLSVYVYAKMSLLCIRKAWGQ